MSYLANDPAAFADEFVSGFVAANARIIRRVPGGIARRTVTPEGQVALVIGGGSGHYPAFAGLVGPGLAQGAALGNVFASPSMQQIYGVAKAVATDAGVLLSYGNYAGDVLNFDQAQARLIAEGVPCRTVVVTDDVSSAAKSERHKRRGIAGDLPVFRAAAWAAEQGRGLDEVFEIAQRANDRTRSIGVAFSGCTLPGADHPLFTVPEGRMAVGMGIHGEPGIEERDIATADELAALLVERLLDELPDDIETTQGARAAVILNGLGSVKSEELFVTYRRIAELLQEAGVTIVEPDVGELVTSFEMAGVSLTLMWLDDDLEQAWTSPAAAPAYRKGALPETVDAAEAYEEVNDEPDSVPESSAASRDFAPAVTAALEAIRVTMDEQAGELGRLDAVAGDGDHGIGMQRGATAAARAAFAAADEHAGAGTVLARAADAWADKAGGTSGALWGVALRAVAERMGDVEPPTAQVLAAGLSAARDAIVEFGKAELGDKTMLDAISPFVDAFAASAADGVRTGDAWTSAATTAVAAAAATADLVPKIGRARPHAEKSVGTPDPGAMSFGMAVTAVAGALFTTEH